MPVIGPFQGRWSALLTARFIPIRRVVVIGGVVPGRHRRTGRFPAPADPRRAIRASSRVEFPALPDDTRLA